MRFVFLTLTLAGWISISTPAPAQTLEDVLKRMDQGAEGFKGMVANLKRVTHTAVLNDNSEETGTIRRSGPRLATSRCASTSSRPTSSPWCSTDGKLEKYFPKIQTVQEYDPGKQRQLVDQFLSLGFGTSGKELTRSYEIKYLGADQTMANRPGIWN